MNRSLIPLLAPALVLAGCAPVAQRAYVAPSYDTIVSTTEESHGEPPIHVIWVENHSTVPVRIFAIRLTDCENINVECGVHQTNLRLNPDQRDVAVRVGARNRGQGFHYSFGFSWHVDSASSVALGVLAQSGDSSARVRLAAMQHSDSLRRAETGPHYNDLTQSDFSVLGPRMVAMRAYPDSLVIVPGERTSIERIRLLMLDKQGEVLGQTRWVSWRISGGAVQFEPPMNLIAKRPGRTTIRFRLADQARTLVPATIDDVEYTVIAAYPPDPHAPVFEGRAVDADSKNPLACAAVALEDSAENVVARQWTTSQGTFAIVAPRPGSYRVRVETPGWAPVFGPTELAKPDEDRQHAYLVRFTDRLLTPRYLQTPDDIEHAHPTALSMEPQSSARGAKRGKSTPIVSAVTLGGSEAMPILGIVGRAPQGTMWMQFVVDSTGKVDPESISLPAGSDPKALASVTSVLPRVRFAPARDAGKPVCELLRMQVNFSGR